MKNKILKLVIINIIIILILVILTELGFYLYFTICKNRKYIPYLYNRKDIINTMWYKPDRFKPYDSSIEHKAKPILMLGCSYTYGQWLEEEQNAASKINKLTGRHVYNYGTIGQGPMYSYLLMEEEEANPKITEKPEYIIYTYMFHHMNRYMFWQFYNTYRKQQFVNQKYIPVLDRLYLFSYPKNARIDIYMCDDDNGLKRVELLKTTIKKIKEKTDKLYPNSKFIFLIYSDINYDLCDGLIEKHEEVVNKEDDTEKNKYQNLFIKIFDFINNKINEFLDYKVNLLPEYNEQNYENIENVDKTQLMFDLIDNGTIKQAIESIDGVEVITTEELIGRKMDRPEDRIPSSIDPNHPHPSEKAWDEIIPKLVKKFDL